jgi:hypothetical protein
MIRAAFFKAIFPTSFHSARDASYCRATPCHVACLGLATKSPCATRPKKSSVTCVLLPLLWTDRPNDSHVRRILHRPTLLVTLSGRLVANRLATLARRTPLHTPRLYTTNTLPAGGLLRNEAGLRLIKRRPWPLGSYALHNIPATRSISFARIIPKLVGKFATVGAATGGAVIAGVSYIQYQAGRTYSKGEHGCRN